MEIRISIDDHTVVYANGGDIRTAWKNAIDEFTNWVEQYNTWTPAERASAMLPTDWQWEA